MTTSVSSQYKLERHALWLALLTAALSFGWFLLDGHLKINLADEGYLWYGTEAMRRGEIPMRDFNGYDPGRYLWCAGWSHLIGDGLLSLRLSCVVFQCFGVFAGLLAARRLSKNWVFLLCVALLLCAWMHPRFKVFEQSIALLAIYAGVLLLERPSLWRHWWVGVFGGLSAIMGRNHGAYHLLAFGLLIAWTAWDVGLREYLRRSFVWGAGLFVGYLPQVLMFLFVPGFFRAFWPFVSGVLATGSTNLPKRVPWPWLIREDLIIGIRLAAIVEGCWYVALLVILILALLQIWRLGRACLAAHPLFLAGFAVSLPYTHYVFSRPDIIHLSHAAPVAALAGMALAATFRSYRSSLASVMAAILFVASLGANFFQFGVSVALQGEPGSTVEMEVRGDRVVVSRWQARILEGARHVAFDLARTDEPILFLPHFPALYPVTQRVSPTSQIYFVMPEPDAALLEEIKAKKVSWVFIHEYALDGREELRFRNTNPLSTNYLRQHFEIVPIAILPPDIVVLHRRAAAEL